MSEAEISPSPERSRSKLLLFIMFPHFQTPDSDLVALHVILSSPAELVLATLIFI